MASNIISSCHNFTLFHMFIFRCVLRLMYHYHKIIYPNPLRLFQHAENDVVTLCHKSAFILFSNNCFEVVACNIAMFDTSTLLQVQCISNWPWTRVTGWTLLLVRTPSSTFTTMVLPSMDILFKGTEEKYDIEAMSKTFTWSTL